METTFDEPLRSYATQEFRERAPGESCEELRPSCSRDDHRVSLNPRRQPQIVGRALRLPQLVLLLVIAIPGVSQKHGRDGARPSRQPRRGLKLKDVTLFLHSTRFFALFCEELTKGEVL